MRSISFLFTGSAQVTDNTFRTIGAAGFTHITTMQDQPVVCIEQVSLRYVFEQFAFNDQRCFSQRKPGPVGNTEYMGVHCHGGLTESRVENHVRGFTSDTGQGLKRLPV